MTKYIATITPPTPNGDLHIGHISGPFLAADVFARVQRQLGHECLLLSYSDDYQSYMLRKGLELNRAPEQLAIENTERIEASLKAMGIAMDHWMRPYGNPFFVQAVAEVFEAARAADAIAYRESQEPYCPRCDRWGYEAFGRGRCNFCGHDSDASQCEECALAPDAASMKDFHCKLCGQPPQWRPVKRAFLKLSHFRALLKAVHARMPQRQPLRSWVAKAIESHLDDWAITRPGDAGLDLAPDGSCRVHTWFMGLAGYMAATREFAQRAGRPELFGDTWGSSDAELVHFLGFDCAYSHCIVYPALLSMLPQMKIRQRFISNMFLKLDGKNLSTSRNHAIWVSDLTQRVSADAARLYLASIAPESGEGNFKRPRFDAWHAVTFGELVPALLAHGGRQHRSLWSELNGEDARLIEVLRARWLDAANPAHFSIKSMAQTLLDALEFLRGRLRDDRPVLHLAAFVAVAGQALMPDTAEHLMKAYRLPREAVTDFLVHGSAADYCI